MPRIPTLALLALAAAPAFAADATTVPFNTYWNAERHDLWGLASEMGQNAALNVFHYTKLRTEGHIFKDQHPGTIAIHTHWNESRTDNFNVASQGSLDEAKADGYDDKATEGYIYAAPHEGAIALKLYVNPSNHDHYATATAEGEADAKSRGYAFVRIEGYILP